MRKLYSIVITSFFISFQLNAQDFNTELIQKHISTLADDRFEGRASGSNGEKLAGEYIIQTLKSLKIQPLGNSYLQAFEFNRGVHGSGVADTAFNIIAYLDNKAKTTVIIGAHYDHLGVDGEGSSLDANPKNKIHNGADDNASGVAGVLELARYFSTNKLIEKDNFIFICFSGEELGLLGSKYFSENSQVDLTTIDYMINMDMIGRLNKETKSLIINGTGTSPVWEPVIKKLNRPELVISTDSSGTGPSDHTSFYLKNIPVLHFFTGSHSDYHKPTDDADKINLQGEVQVLNFIKDIILELNDSPKLTFLKTKMKKQASVSTFKVTMGIMPSYASDVKGLKVDGVTEGKPAYVAGIQTGDIIIRMGQFEIKDIYSYMEALGKFEKGQEIPVVVQRDGEDKTFTVKF